MASKTTNYGLHKFDLTDSPPDITVINDSMDKIDAELKKRLENTKAIPVENGGTGKATKKEAFDNLAFLGNNPISSTDEDTTQKWCELGSGYAWYTTDGLLVNQPFQYMFIINYIQDKDVFQIGYEQKVGTIYYRGGNYSGWIMNWTPLLSTKGGTMSGKISMDGNGIVFSKDADWNNGNYFAMFESQNTLGMQVRHNGKNRFFNFNDNTHTIDKAFQMWWYDDGKEHSSRFFGEHNTSLLATTIQNLIDKGEIHMEKQYIISDSGMTTETFANNVSCIGLQSNEIKVLGKFFPQYNGLILVKTKATNNYSDSLSLLYSNLHDGNRYGSSSLHSAENYYMTNQAAADKEATMLYNNVKISPGTILNNANTTLVSMSSEIDSWYQNATGYSYKVLMVQKNMPVTFYCNSSNSKSDSGLTNITLQIMYKVV